MFCVFCMTKSRIILLDGGIALKQKSRAAPDVKLTGGINCTATIAWSYDQKVSVNGIVGRPLFVIRIGFSSVISVATNT